MHRIDRLPAIPLIANDPYFSIWMPADTLTEADSVHWTGAGRPLRGRLTVDGATFRFLGLGDGPAMETVGQYVTPTSTVSEQTAGGVLLSVRFTTPVLPDDPDTLSAPVTLVDFALSSADGKEHEAALVFTADDSLTWNGAEKPAMYRAAWEREGLRFALCGQQTQKPLCHSGDNVTIDWGYLYLAAAGDVRAEEEGLAFRWEVRVPARGAARAGCCVAYDDIASINYFGSLCRAWHARHGESVPEAILRLHARRDALLHECDVLDAAVTEEAERIGGRDYAAIAAAAWRHTFAAHKLIATPEGEMALISKENDSGGCAATVDVSYPSVPLFLRFCPEMVNALCRPALRFASLPVWEFDFAPHDVGRYPYATGQVYGCRARVGPGETFPPYWLFPAGTDPYKREDQMPVEECGNMLVMLCAATAFGAEDGLVREYEGLLDTWARYLTELGEDPGEQLCTDDFAGHLAHNVNLAAKATVGAACYARIRALLGRESAEWEEKARAMARSWLERARVGEATALTFDGQGWSIKYNLVWDRVLDLGLLPEEFYARETDSYLARQNTYGLPLDSRKTYTKSDWILWAASMAPKEETFRALIAPVARYLRETRTRVAFSDWYDTVTGDYVHFIGRSVQGGLYMPFIARAGR